MMASEPVAVYEPPPGPPPGHAIPLTYPLTTPEESSNLRSHGYARLTLPSRSHPLYTAALNAFSASAAFFALPEVEKIKHHIEGSRSEEGYAKVLGEKEMITIRNSDGISCPPTLSKPAELLWNACGEYLDSILRYVESSLDLPQKTYAGITDSEIELRSSTSDRPESLLRMFRYDRSMTEYKVVSAPHKDIGLLTLVIGSSPGLDAFDTHTSSFLPVENSSSSSASVDSCDLTFTLLTGATLTCLTNGLYTPGVHRVYVPPSANHSDIYRYSLVYALRPTPSLAPASIIRLASLTTNITGSFHPSFAQLLDGNSCRDIFKRIQNEFWSVNVGGEERDKQRKRLEILKQKAIQQQALKIR